VNVWIDAQLSPALAAWMAERFGVVAHSAQRMGLRDVW
jgi:predicted nuclease of predicted toxin-antitoxin system